MRTKRLALYVAPFVLLVVVGAFLFVQRPSAWSRLPSGVEVRLAEVTQGTNQQFIAGLPWQKALYRALPAALKSWSDCRIMKFSSYDSGAIFWLEERGSSGEQSGDSPEIQIRYLDRYGCELEENGSSIIGALSQDNSIRYLGLQHDVYGAHGEIAGLALREKVNGEESEPSIELLMSEPLLAARKGDLPDMAVQQVGEFEFRLRRFMTGLEGAPPAYNLRSWTPQFSQLEFLVTRKDGSVCRDWIPEQIRFLNEDRPRFPEGLQRARRGDALVLNFDGLLNAGETIPFEVRFTQHRHFAPEQMVTMHDVNLPGGETRAADITVVSGGVTLRLIEMGGANANRPSDSVVPKEPYVCVTATPATGLNVWLMEAKGELGALQVATRPAGGGKFYFMFQGPFQPGVVTLKFAVHSSQWLKFEERPVAW